jgi:hypothetical protein
MIVMFSARRLKPGAWEQLSAFVENEYVSGVYEVVDVVDE